MRVAFGIVFLFMLLVSCKDSVNPDVVARVNGTYLLHSDIKTLLDEQMTPQDSAAVIGNHVTTWATRQLFLDRAKENLSDAKLAALDALVDDYRNSLYAKVYKDALISKTLDTVVTPQAIALYYQENKRNFNLNKTLVKLRYLYLDNSFAEIAATRQSFARYNKKDREGIINMKYAYKACSLNDSIWVAYDQLVRKVPLLATKKQETVLKSNGVLQLKDSLGVYLIKIKAVRGRKETAPLSYISSTIRQIIVNKRKLALIKKLEKDITKDAIKNEQFEIYN